MQRLLIVLTSVLAVAIAALESGLCTGNTIAGSTNWQTHGTDGKGLYVDVDTSACGFKSTPVYVTSRGGTVDHYKSTGGSEIYEATNKGFKIFVHDKFLAGGITPTKANAKKWRVNWIADGNGTGVSDQGACVGKTDSASTQWVQKGADTVTVTVDTSKCGFTGEPLYFTSLSGDSGHWESMGSSEIYESKATSFQIQIYQKGLTVAKAKKQKLYVNWMGKGAGLAASQAQSPCSGETVAGSTNWVQSDGLNGVYVDVNTRNCGFTETPVYITSIHAESSIDQTKGSSNIYHAEPGRFVIYIYHEGINPKKANEYKWRISWMASAPVLPTPAPTLAPTPAPTTAPPALDFGADGCFVKPCDVCRGDCNNDSECAGTLKCFQREDRTNVPGCAKGGYGDVTGWNYCSTVAAPTLARTPAQ